MAYIPDDDRADLFRGGRQVSGKPVVHVLSASGWGRGIISMYLYLFNINREGVKLISLNFV